MIRNFKIERIDKWTGKWIDGSMDGWVCGWMDARLDGWFPPDGAFTPSNVPTGWCLPPR